MFTFFFKAIILYFSSSLCFDLFEINIANPVWYLSIQVLHAPNHLSYPNDLAVIDLISSEENYCSLMHLEFFTIAIRKIFIDQLYLPNIHLSLTQRSMWHWDYNNLQIKHVSPKESKKLLSSCTSVTLDFSKQYICGSCWHWSQVDSFQCWLQGLCVSDLYEY